MSDNEKSQLVNKLLRWTFIFIVVLSLLQIPLFTLLTENEPSYNSLDMGGNEMFFLIGASIVGIVLAAILIFGVGPVVIRLVDIRKKEKEDKEDLGIFP